MERTDRNIAEYLESLPEDVRDDMQTLDREIAEVMYGMPTALFEGKFWGGTDQEIIGYGVGTYTRPNKSEVEWFLVGLARQKNYISLYVNAVEDGRYLSETLGKDLGKVKVGKASISFTRLDDIDRGKLTALVKRARELGWPQ
jgi:hypothetical protein